MEWPPRPKKAKALPEGAIFGEMWPEANYGVLWGQLMGFYRISSMDDKNRATKHKDITDTKSLFYSR
jgi:hypothetical protein